MSNFDRNRWYEIQNMASTNQQSISGKPDWASVDDPNQSGVVQMTESNPTDSSQQWQIWAFNASYYALRTAASMGPQWLRVGDFLPRNDTGNEQRVNMKRTPENTTDQSLMESMFWRIGQWPDGSYYFTNAANGTGWLMLRSVYFGMLAMKQETTMLGNESRFAFKELGLINNSSFSVGTSTYHV